MSIRMPTTSRSILPGALGVLLAAAGLAAGPGCAAPPGMGRAGASAASPSSALPAAAQSLLRSVDALIAAGKPTEAVALVDRKLPGATEPELRARLLLAQSRGFLAGGRTQSAHLAAQRGLGELTEPRGELARELLTIQGDVELRRKRPREAARRYLEALDAAARPPETLRYRAYLALKESGDARAEEQRRKLIPFDADKLARAERELLDRKPAPPPASPVAKPAAPAKGSLPSDLDEILPGIQRRKAWGAAAIRGSYDPMTPIERLTVHHSTMPNWTSWEMPAELRNLQASHQNKWADLGYHFLIDAGGGVWEGRELRWQGAHEGAGLNRGAIGICLTGNFILGKPTPPQLESLRRLLEGCRARFGLAVSAVKTHQEVRSGPTECPGTSLQAWVEAYRRTATASLARQ